MKRNITVSMLALIAIAMGCSMMRNPSENDLKEHGVVLILVDPYDYKDSLARSIADHVTEAGYQPSIIDVKHAGKYKASNFAAVIYMAEYWMWHVPFHAKRYFKNNDEGENIVFIITSGDPDVHITKPFDAVTTASDSDRKDAVLNEVFSRLDQILEL